MKSESKMRVKKLNTRHLSGRSLGEPPSGFKRLMRWMEGPPEEMTRAGVCNYGNSVTLLACARFSHRSGPETRIHAPAPDAPATISSFSPVGQTIWYRLPGVTKANGARLTEGVLATLT